MSGVAAHNRGSRVISRSIDADHGGEAAVRRSHVARVEDENAALRQRVATLETELKRARRCIALGRFAHEQRMIEAAMKLSASNFAVRTLVKLAARLGAPGFEVESDDFRGLIRMAVKNRIWFEIAGDNVWVGTDHYPHGGDVDTAIAILERELRERAIRYGAAAGAAKKGA